MPETTASVLYLWVSTAQVLGANRRFPPIRGGVRKTPGTFGAPFAESKQTKPSCGFKASRASGLNHHNLSKMTVRCNQLITVGRRYNDSAYNDILDITM